MLFKFCACFTDLCTGDLVAFFNRCKSGLNSNGMIFVKENVSKKTSLVDDEDYSVTR